MIADAPLLVVDDNPINLELAQAILELAGYRVRTATDAAEALLVIAAERPRLILMDVQLPGMDGLTLTRQLKADPKTRDIVVVALTAYAMKGDAQKALDAGCDGYVSKPVDVHTLTKIVAGFLGGEAGTQPAAAKHA